MCISSTCLLVCCTCVRARRAQSTCTNLLIQQPFLTSMCTLFFSVLFQDPTKWNFKKKSVSFRVSKCRATVLAGRRWNVTRLTAPCCGTQIPLMSPTKGPFFFHLQAHTRTRHTWRNTQCSEITENQSESSGECSVRTVPLLIVRLLWRAISSARRKRVCARVCVFSTPGGSVTCGVREFSIKIFLCNCRTQSSTCACVCVCAFIHACILSA